MVLPRTSPSENKDSCLTLAAMRVLLATVIFAHSLKSKNIISQYFKKSKFFLIFFSKDPFSRSAIFNKLMDYMDLLKDIYYLISYIDRIKGNHLKKLSNT